MRKSPSVAILILVVVVCLSYLLLQTLETKVERKEFAAYAEVHTGDRVADQWIPENMPPSATEIRARYGLSPSFLMIEFVYDPRDHAFLTDGFIEVDDPIVAATMIKNLSEKNWNTEIDGRVSLLASKTNETALHQAYLIIDRATNRVWYSVD